MPRRHLGHRSGGISNGCGSGNFCPTNTVFESGSASIDVFLPITAGAKNVSLRVNEYQGNESLVAYASMSVLYVPFGATGTDTSPAAADGPVLDPVVR